MSRGEVLPLSERIVDDFVQFCTKWGETCEGVAGTIGSGLERADNPSCSIVLHLLHFVQKYFDSDASLSPVEGRSINKDGHSCPLENLGPVLTIQTPYQISQHGKGF